jgi:hypothetical protein
VAAQNGDAPRTVCLPDACGVVSRTSASVGLAWADDFGGSRRSSRREARRRECA